mmetsp:Transcript_121795/g.191183  ORF Transcript_121795/g.191183 Transcript_121795/m.191183 type:complete len:298 (+) Transcript_121795:622-1515(+)
MASRIKATASVSSFKACRNSASSLLRNSNSSSWLFLVALMSLFTAVISVSTSVFLLPIRPNLSSALSISWPRSSNSFLFAFSLFSQISRCSMSSCSSFLRRPIMSSIMPMTLSKWPPFLTATAILAKPRLWNCDAKVFNRPYALVAPLLALCFCIDFNCKNVVVAFAKIFCADSLVNTLIAASMPCISSVRKRVRVDHSLAFVWHASFVSAKNASSAFNCSTVSSFNTSLSFSCFVFEASSLSCFCNVACKVSSSCNLVAMSSSNDFWLSASPALSFSKSAVKASYIPLSMPWICVD